MQTILSQEQIKLLQDANIRHNFLGNTTPLNPKSAKSQKRRLNRILKRYNFGIGVTWAADYHILVLAWLVMKQSNYRNLQGENPADLITQDVIYYPSYDSESEKRVRDFYMTMPQVLTKDELSWFFHHMYNILYRYSKETIVDLTWYEYHITSEYVNIKGNQKFMQAWLLERLNAIAKNNDAKDVYRLFAVWRYVASDFWW